MPFATFGLAAGLVGTCSGDGFAILAGGEALDGAAAGRFMLGAAALVAASASRR